MHRMDGPDRSGDRIERIRRWLLWVLVLGLVGTEAELLLLEHYEDPWQLIPLFLIALGMAVLAWHATRRDAASLRALRVLMVLFLVAGFVGVVLHFRGAAEFQLEIDPAMGSWDLVKKVMRAKAPPVLAPGVMLQLGLIGLAYAFTNSREKRSEMS
jgi:hypothetical protein